MASFKAALLVKFPGTTLADMDAYKGSVIVEVTVTSESSSGTRAGILNKLFLLLSFDQLYSYLLGLKMISSSAISKKIDQMKSEFEGGFDWSYNGTAMKLATFDADSG